MTAPSNSAQFQVDGSSYGASLTIALGFDHVDGEDIVIAFRHWHDTDYITSVVINGATVSTRGVDGYDAGSDYASYIFLGKAVPAGTDQITFNWSATNSNHYLTGIVEAWPASYKVGDAIDAYDGDTGAVNRGTGTTPTVTATFTSDPPTGTEFLSYAVAGLDANPAGLTIPSGWESIRVEQDNSAHVSAAIAKLEDTKTSTKTATFGSNTGNWDAAILCMSWTPPAPPADTSLKEVRQYKSGVWRWVHHMITAFTSLSFFRKSYVC